MSGCPLEYKDCFLYGLLSTRKLKELLHIRRNVYCKSSFINPKINVYIDKNNRIIEAPDADIKAIQRIIAKALSRIAYPSFIFSGIKERGYRKIETLHRDFPNTLCIDIRKFFYNIPRDAVYFFFKKELLNSPDVSEILTNLLCVDLAAKNYCGSETIKSLIRQQQIKPNHLIAGAPTSTNLSYLVNRSMFEELNRLAEESHCLFSLYVDDLIFSSDQSISEAFIENVVHILNKYHYSIATEKTRLFRSGEKKKIF